MIIYHLLSDVPEKAQHQILITVSALCCYVGRYIHIVAAAGVIHLQWNAPVSFKSFHEIKGVAIMTSIKIIS